ncbi:MAG: Mur ligase family protein [Gaiellaceae bacterium]
MTRWPERAVVLGLARSGRAAAAALERRGVAVVGVDRTQDTDRDEGSLEGAGLLVKSPGVPGEHELVRSARRRGIPVWSEVELGSRLLPNPLLGVTGTNGKTTTVELLGAIFRAAGRAVAVAGNVGTALCELDGRLPADAWIVCELSSFQLEDVHDLRPRVAVLLNLEPDHLDRHGTVERYRGAKLRIFENQRPEDAAVVPRRLGPVPGRAKRVEFDAADPLPAEPRIPGAHNRENAAAASAAATAAGVDERAIAKGLREFPGVPHRLELVAEIGGVRFVNDSKATNVAAARRGLAAHDGPVRLILGGSLKQEPFGPLAGAIGPNVRGIYLVGEAAEQIAAALESRGIAYRRSGDLERAVRDAAAAAVPGDTVLLSPACASYDQFENFEHRGEEYRRLVQNLEA